MLMLMLMLWWLLLLLLLLLLLPRFYGFLFHVYWRPDGCRSAV
jgi:hypothetical protein